MVDKPIIFSASMVRALIEGRKTQTRRILKLPLKQFEHPSMGGWEPCVNGGGGCFRLGRGGERIPVAETVGIWHRTTGWCQDAPHQAGDRLWVKEEARRSPDLWAYSADESPVPWPGRQDIAGRKRDICNSMFLPRSCSRLTLEVTEVRVERLASISREDAIAEGATSRPHCYGPGDIHDGWSMDWSQVGKPSRFAANGHTLAERDVALWNPQDAFGSFINELHDPRWNHKGDGIFGANPWVAAISFRVILANIDAPPASPLATGEAA